MTTTSTTSSTNPATSSTATLLASLGTGSGIDVNAIVTQLAAAQKQPREDLITARTTANQAKVSALGQISNGIDTFASALTGLIAGGTLYSQPSVSDPSVFTASAVAGASLSGLSAQVEVRQLAQAQTLSSTPLAARTDSVGQGVLTLTVGGTNYDVTIDSTNDSLDGLVKAINDKNAGVTASVVTDSSGARLVIKGKTGAANAFTLSVPDGTNSGLERFATGAMNVAQEAKDAEIKLDGVTVYRATNSFSDLIPGVQMNLQTAKVGTTVSVGVTRPTDAINQAVQDFVSAYNTLMGEITDATKMTVSSDGSGATGGVLRGDIGVTSLQRQLASLPTMKLSTTGTGVHTLAEIGVSTNRDGTLSVDTAKLTSMLASDPDGVEALFNPTQYTSSPFLTVKSPLGRVAPGTYTVTNVTAANGGNAAGTLNGVAMQGTGNNLIAPIGSSAAGLIIGVTGNVASATITIDPGLGGALQAIRDGLRSSSGAFANTQTRLADEAKQITADQSALDTSSQKYYDQLLANFTAMDSKVSAYKATQSYLTQQVKMWTNGN